MPAGISRAICDTVLAEDERDRSVQHEHTRVEPVGVGLTVQVRLKATFAYLVALEVFPDEIGLEFGSGHGVGYWGGQTDGEIPGLRLGPPVPICLAPSARRTPDMATRRTATKERAPKRDEDEARFEAWLKDFDTRQADLTARLDAILHSLGVDPAKVPEPA